MRTARGRHETSELPASFAQEGLCDGATLYHALVQKSEAEVAATAARRAARDEGRAARRVAQETNVERKRAAEGMWEGQKRRREVDKNEGEDKDEVAAEAEDDEEETAHPPRRAPTTQKWAHAAADKQQKPTTQH